MKEKRYRYTHHGPPVYDSKLMDYLISEHNLREDYPDLFYDRDEMRKEAGG